MALSEAAAALEFLKEALHLGYAELNETERITLSGDEEDYVGVRDPRSVVPDYSPDDEE